MRKAIITGGASGIGAAVVKKLREKYHVFVLDVAAPSIDEAFYKTDICDGTAVKNTFEQIGAFDVLIHAASIYLPQELVKMPDGEIARQMEVNLTGTALVNKYALQRVDAVLPGPIDTPLLRNAFSSEEEFSTYLATNLMGRIGAPEEVAKLVGFILFPTKQLSSPALACLLTEGNHSRVLIRHGGRSGRFSAAHLHCGPACSAPRRPRQAGRSCPNGRVGVRMYGRLPPGWPHSLPGITKPHCEPKDETSALIAAADYLLYTT